MRTTERYDWERETAMIQEDAIEAVRKYNANDRAVPES